MLIFEMFAEKNDGTYALCVTRAEVEAVAAARGCVVVEPESRELFIDIDSEEANETFEWLFECFKKHEVASMRRTPSPSGMPGHFHVIVTLERDVHNAAERILLQACLGSDPMRELLSWRRLQAESECVTVFFEKAVEAEKEKAEK